MLLFDKRKAICDFYNKHKAFLDWYLTKHSNISEKLYYLLMWHIVECLHSDIGKLIRLDEKEQRTWIMKRVDDFANDEEGCLWGIRKKSKTGMKN